MKWIRKMECEYGYTDTCSNIKAYKRDKTIGIIVIISLLIIIMTIVGVK